MRRNQDKSLTKKEKLNGFIWKPSKNATKKHSEPHLPKRIKRHKYRGWRKFIRLGTRKVWHERRKYINTEKSSETKTTRISLRMNKYWKRVTASDLTNRSSLKAETTHRIYYIPQLPTENNYFCNKNRKGQQM